MPKGDEFIRQLREVFAHLEDAVIDVINVPEVPDVPIREHHPRQDAGPQL